LDFGDAAPVQAQYASGQFGAALRDQYPTLYTCAAYLAGRVAKPHDVVFFDCAGHLGSQSYTTLVSQRWSDRRRSRRWHGLCVRCTGPLEAPDVSALRR
jgi:hypothetical protein